MNTSQNELESSISCDEKETKDWAQSIAARFNPGDVILLKGDLGAGKTQAVKGFCQFWGISEDEVLSPTFTLVNEYWGSHKIVHVDLFRLEKEKDCILLDLDTYLFEEAILLIEWGDKFPKLWDQYYEVEIKIEGEQKRQLILRRTTQ